MLKWNKEGFQFNFWNVLDRSFWGIIEVCYKHFHIGYIAASASCSEALRNNFQGKDHVNPV